MRRQGLVAFGFALALAFPAGAGTVTTGGSAQIGQRVSVDMNNDVSFRTLDVQAAAITPSIGTAPIDASLRVTAQQGDSLSLAVPAEIDLTRDGGAEFVTIATRDLEGDDFDRPAVLTLGTMNFRIGGDVEVAVNQIVPGRYRGVLLITVQFN